MERFLPRRKMLLVVLLLAEAFFFWGEAVELNAAAAHSLQPNSPPVVGGRLSTQTLTATRVYLPIVSSPQPHILIAAAHIDSVLSGEADEALMLWNVGDVGQSLAGWQLTANGHTATFPITSPLTSAPGAHIWCAAEAATFRRTFGFDPSCEWRADSDPAVPDLAGSRLRLTNGGGVIQLRNPTGQVVDTLLYGDADRTVSGWEGRPAQLYSRGAIPGEGQIWRRKLEAVSGQPLDTDRASDWSGDLADLDWGRRAAYPGWQVWLDGILAKPTTSVEAATISVAVGPEGLYRPLADHLAAAQQRIDLSLYTFEHPALAALLSAAARRGVQVRLLLEGSPSGGIDDLQRWCLAQLADAGVDIYYLTSREDAPNGYRPRYRFLHAKYGVVDGKWVFVGTDNFTLDSMPMMSDGVPRSGRRGAYLFTDAPSVVQGLSRIFATDWAPERFLDLRPFYAQDPTHGGPPPGYRPPDSTERIPIDSPFIQPVTSQGVARFALVSAPDNALRPDTGLLALIRRAGAGDAIRWVQLYEHKFWGDSTSNPIADPNVRLQALLGAARRGATVRVLLDEFFDDATDLRSNRATVDYLESVAAVEGLDLQARTGNPTQLGIHAKIALLQVEEERWSAVGSLNGGEVSNKLNREVVLMTDAPAIYARLVQVFDWDWQHSVSQ